MRQQYPPYAELVLVQHMDDFVARNGKSCIKCGRPLEANHPRLGNGKRCSPKHYPTCDRATKTALAGAVRS